VALFPSPYSPEHESEVLAILHKQKWEEPAGGEMLMALMHTKGPLAFDDQAPHHALKVKAYDHITYLLSPVLAHNDSGCGLLTAVSFFAIRDIVTNVVMDAYNKGYAQAKQDAHQRGTLETECAWNECRNESRAGSKYCSRNCSNKNARFRAAERRPETP
jgi:hypothetical protein